MSIIQGTSKAAGGGYEIDQSIRFNDDDSAYLNRTFGSAGNRKTYTFSGWFKRANILGANTTLALAVQAGGLNSDIHIQSDEKMRFRDQGNSLNLITNQVFRDPGAWFHIVASVDTTQPTASNRAKLYLNGSQITSFGTETYMAQNSEGLINSADNVEIGRNPNGSVFWDGYMAELTFVDGTALDPTDFGETNDDGVWVPKAYTNAAGYGTNGFYITGSTASDLGEDFSGNGNDFTSSGLTTTDQMLDTPTLNFCTLNPLITPATMTLTDGNLALSGYTAVTSAYGTFGMSSGKWYWELVAQTNAMAGVAATPNGSQYPGQAADSYAFDLTNGTKYNNGSSSAFGAAAVSASDTVGVAFDADNGDLKFYNNSGTLIGTAFTGLTSGPYFPMFRNGSGANISINFGQQTFSHSLPTSHVALSTASLPTPSIKDGSKYFDTKLWTGNDTDGRAITGYNFSPDLVWIKSRSGAYSHNITDTVRGAGNYIQSNTTDAEVAGPDAFGSTLAFTSDGFTLDNGTYDNLYVNGGGETYVGWGWKANGAGSSNTDGSITSTVSANTTAGFSIVTYTGNSSASTVGHGLGAAPAMVIVKKRGGTANEWAVWNKNLSAAQILLLNSTAAAYDPGDNDFQDTAPTSSVFYITATDGRTNSSGVDFVAYCFAEIPGYSSFGSYSGNGSTDGPMIYTNGMKPAFVLIKRTNAAENWLIMDGTRYPNNPANNPIFANTSNADANGGRPTDFLSNGFKPRNTLAGMNASGSTYIYMAFAEHPFGGDGVAPATAR